MYRKKTPPTVSKDDLFIFPKKKKEKKSLQKCPKGMKVCKCHEALEICKDKKEKKEVIKGKFKYGFV